MTSSDASIFWFSQHTHTHTCALTPNSSNHIVSARWCPISGEFQFHFVGEKLVQMCLLTLTANSSTHLRLAVGKSTSHHGILSRCTVKTSPSSWANMLVWTFFSRNALFLIRIDQVRPGFYREQRRGFNFFARQIFQRTWWWEQFFFRQIGMFFWIWKP